MTAAADRIVVVGANKLLCGAHVRIGMRLLWQLGDLGETPGFATPPRDGCALIERTHSIAGVRLVCVCSRARSVAGLRKSKDWAESGRAYELFTGHARLSTGPARFCGHPRNRFAEMSSGRPG